MTKDPKENPQDVHDTKLEHATHEMDAQAPIAKTGNIQESTTKAETSKAEAAPFEQSFDTQDSDLSSEKLPENLTENTTVENSSNSAHIQGVTAPLNFASSNEAQKGEAAAHSAQERAQASTQNSEQNSTQNSEHTSEQMAEQQEAQAPAPAMGFAAKCFGHMSKLAPLYLLLLFALHICSSIWLPSVYFPVEMAHVEIYQKMQAAGQWLIPPVSEALGATLPGYYWFMALVDLLPLPDSIYLPTLSALAALIALCGIYALGVCTKVGRHASFGGALVLLSCPLFLIFMHMVGPQMLTAGFFALACALLYRGWTKDSAPFSFIFGFLFLTLATFTGGFIPLWTALLASILLIIWRGTLHRAHQLDAVIGFGVMILSFALWLVLSILGSEHASALDAIMLTAIAPFMPPYWPLPLPWALAFLAFGLLPWIVLPLFVAWFKVLATSFSALKASRKDNSGPAWLYLLALLGMALVLLQKDDNLFSALFLLPIFGVILAKTVCNLSRFGSNVYFLLLAIALLVGGVAITIVSIPSTAPYWTPYIAEDLARMLGSVQGLPLLSAVFILTALLLVRFTQRAFSEGALLVMALFFVLIAQPMTLFVAPSLVGHGAMQHEMGTGLGTLPPSIAPHMPTHPVGHQRVAPIEGEEIVQNPEPTPVITAPEPASEPISEPVSEPEQKTDTEQNPEQAQEQVTQSVEIPSETQTEPQTEPSTEPKVEPQVNLQMDTQTEPQVQPTPDPALTEPSAPVAPATPEEATTL